MADWRGNMNSRNGRTEEMLDAENQRGAERLSEKVSMLKGFALDMETEAKDQNKYMDDVMSGDFSSTQGLLSGSMNRINHVVTSAKGNRRLMCYIILGLVSLFFLAYYLISRVTGG